MHADRASWSEQEVVAWIADVKDGFEGKRRKV
jgi:prophage regulatory protein